MLSVNWEVNTTADYSTWTEGDSTISLREAVSRAGDGDTITFSSSLVLTTLNLKYGEMQVNASITIDATDWRTAAGVNRIVLRSTSGARIFNVAEDASLTLMALNLRNGISTGDGGAIYSYGSLVMNDCNITGCSAAYGGTVYSYHGQVTVSGGSISNCSASDQGGGIYAYHGTLTIENCTIDSNTAKAAGGIGCLGTSSTIRHTTILNNEASNENYFAGGIYVLYGTMIITDSQIVENISYNYGGGMYIHDSEVSITNSLIADNSSAHTGAGIESFGKLTLTQCTIAGNITTGEESEGAGLYNYYGYGLSMEAYNCIFVENTCASGKTSCDYAGHGWGYGYNILASTDECWTWIEEYFAYDTSLPIFADPGSQDYSLAENSQAINIGENDYAFYSNGNEIIHDLAGLDRIHDQYVDLGAYEYHPAQRLDTPTGVTVTSAGANRLRIRWNEVENSTCYAVAWSIDQTSWSQGFTTETNLRVENLTYGTTCYFKVMALGDGKFWQDSEYSETVSRIACPVDIDGDGFIGPGDLSILSSAWLSSSDTEDWDERADINGDDDVGPGDRFFLAINWFNFTSSGIIYPPALASLSGADSLFASPDFMLEEVFRQMF